MTTEHTHRDLTAMDITPERLHMEIDQEDYRKPNWTKATAGDVYRMAYRRIKKPWPNGIPNVMPNHLARGLPNDYQEANRYSTEAAYRDGRREVD